MFEDFFNSAIERIYNEILKDPRLYSEIGWNMLLLPVPFLGMGLMVPEITSIFSPQPEAFYQGLPWAFRLVLPNTLLAALPWLLCMSCGAWLAYTAHKLKKYIYL